MTYEGKGPLAGFKMVEMAGIGPGPFCAMVMADLGAEVIRVDRAASASGGDPATPPADLLNRGRRSVAVDLKHPDGVATVLDLVARADALIEGFRPGVMERLGLGPDVCLERNPKLVYGRMTGWGQEGPYASTAGHDINYIALSGALDPVGRRGGPPTPPLNMVGDFGGGAMLLALGICAALLESGRSGEGQVIDASMVDGSALLTTMFHSFIAMGIWEDDRGSNMLDTGAHFYDAYETADGKYVSVGSIEPQFYAELLKHTGLEGEDLPWQHDRAQWPALKERMAEVFKQKTRDEWCEIMEGTDICFAPVLSLTEAPEHPHNQHRGTFVELAGIVQPGPAPRFSRTPGEVQLPLPHAGQHTDEALADWGVPADRIAELRASGAVADVATLVSFHADPDDESIATAGTMAKAKALGHRVVLVVATRGDHGEPVPGVLDDGEPLPVRRTAETYESARVLGVDRVEFLGYVDSGMVDTPTSEMPWSFARTPVDQAAARLAVILGEEQADVITTYDDNGGYGHPDHIQAHRVGARAAELVGLEQVFQNTINRTALIEGSEAMGASLPEGIELPDFSAQPDFGKPAEVITHRVDVAEFTGLKRASMQAHRSQISETDFFLTMPDDMFAVAFGTEWYIADGPAPADGSLAAALFEPIR